MPFEQYAKNENRVVPVEATELLWERLRNDVPINSAQPTDAGTDAGATPSEGTTNPSQAASEEPSDEPADGATGDVAEPSPSPSDPWEVKTGLTETVC